MKYCFFVHSETRSTFTKKTVFYSGNPTMTFLHTGNDTWIVWKMTFFASGKMEVPVRVPVFGGGKKN